MDLEPNGEGASGPGRVEGGGENCSQRVTKSSSHPTPIQRCAWSSRACQPLCSGALKEEIDSCPTPSTSPLNANLRLYILV